MNAYRSPSPNPKLGICDGCGYPAADLKSEPGPLIPSLDSDENMTFRRGPDIEVCHFCAVLDIKRFESSRQPTNGELMRAIAYSTNYTLARIEANQNETRKSIDVILDTQVKLANMVAELSKQLARGVRGTSGFGQG